MCKEAQIEIDFPDTLAVVNTEDMQHKQGHKHRALVILAMWGLFILEGLFFFLMSELESDKGFMSGSIAGQ